jgi:8-oxo-dGTP pyrophosphatase MutT (NUDIX family)
MQTKKEYSAGGVVYKKNDKDQTVFLLGKHSGYRKWVLPKGLIEEDEEQITTAVRETQEEMGIKARLIDNKPLHIETYSYIADYKNSSQSSPQDPEKTRRVKKYQEQGGGEYKVYKTVTFYLMEYVSGDPKNHGWEMEECNWFEFDEALELMSFEGEKQALQKARAKLV